MEQAVDIKGLTKSFKGKKAVDDVTFSINRGEIVAILGPNGAGKSTTIHMMLGLLNPTEGEAKLFGANTKETKIRERIGVMLQEVSLMDGLKVKELLQTIRGFYPDPFSLEQLCRLTGLSEEVLNKRTEKLSGGQKRKVGFAMAIAGNPDLLFFDEPTVGMDISSRKVFWDTVKELANDGKTILFSTHYLQEADDVAERIILFNKGKIAADGTPGEIKNQLLKRSVSFVTNAQLPKELFLQYPSVSDVVFKDGRMIVLTDDTDFILSKIFEKKLDAHDIFVDRGRLEEAFEQLTAEQKEAI